MASKADIAAALRLINTPTVGPKKFYRLVEEQESVDGALALLERESKYKPWSLERALQEIGKAEALGVQILLYTDEAYPKMLSGNTNMPPVLYAKGRIDILQTGKSLAIVGSRAASINGRKTAAHIAKDLTESGVMIVSGMARGIDAAAHKGALYAQNQCGATVAVLGTGVDIPYPDENAGLYEQITEQGCIISELLPGSQPQANNFPRRNRIVAALTQGTLVVEATAQSGSLITAQLAADYGRELFAVPGSPTEPRSIGPNRLIKSGAHLVETAEDIVKHIHSISACPQPRRKAPKQKEFDFAAIESPNSAPTNGQTKIIDYLNADGVYVDEIIRASGLDAAQVALELLELEMDGRIERQSGNKVALIKQKSSR